MNRITTLLALLAAAATYAHGAPPLYITPDVPTTVSVGGTTLLPSQIFRYDPLGPSYTLVLTVPGEPELDAIHKLDFPGAWLFSVRAPSNLGGVLPGDVLPRDLVRFRSGVYALFFCPGALGVPEEANLDGAYMEGGDTGNLVVSFDAPVELPPGGGIWYEPADLIRFVPTGAGCGAWALAAANPAFDASAAGAGIPNSDNVVDAERAGGKVLLALDVPSSLSPSSGPITTYEPGQIASWDGATYDDFEVLVGWPAGSKVEGLACVSSNPGLDSNVQVRKAAAPAGDIVISWSPSCSNGAQDSGIYQGTIGSWYSHTAIDCHDDGGDNQEQITPAAGNVYFLVVPYNCGGEGTYTDLSPSGVARPVGASVCASPRILATSCP
jgi:hypothetical protein